MGTDRSECAETRGGPQRSLHGPCRSRPVPNDVDHLRRSPVRRSRSLERDRLTRTVGLLIRRIVRCEVIDAVFAHHHLLSNESVNGVEKIPLSHTTGGLVPRIL